MYLEKKKKEKVMEVTEEQIKEINETVRKSNLKIQGLLDRVGTQAQNYENLVADLRIEITDLNDEVLRLRKQSEPSETVEHEYPVAQDPDDIVEAEVVS